MLDHLCLKARVVAAALLHLAVDDLVKGNLALDIARGLGDLLVRQAALLHLAGTQAKHQTGVVEHMGLAGVVQIDADLLGDADLVGGKAAGIVERLDGIDQVLCHRLVLDGRDLATLGQNSLVVAELFNHTFLHRGRCNCLSIRYPHIFMRKIPSVCYKAPNINMRGTSTFQRRYSS